MSMMYCHEHGVHFDTDKVENCPQCCEECEQAGGEPPCIDRACPHAGQKFSKEVPAHAKVRSEEINYGDRELTADEEDFIAEPEHHK